MHKIINISVLLAILSLLSVCAPEQTDNIVVPQKEKLQSSQKLLINKANNNILRQLKTEYKNNKTNMVISSLANNSLNSIILFSTKNSKQNREQINEILDFNEFICNNDNSFDINYQTELYFDQGIKFNKKFNIFLEKHKHYKLQYTDIKINTKAKLDIKNSLSGKFYYAKQTGIGEAPFYLSPNNSKFVKMLICEDAFNYFNNDYMKVVELPIGNGSFSALFIIPESGFSLKHILRLINPYILKTIENNFRKLKMSVFIPEINVLYTKSNKNTDTPFKNMSNQNIYLNKIEDFTRLKSLSKIKNRKKSNLNNSLFIDRPFIFIIKEKYSDAIIFIGQIVNP